MQSDVSSSVSRQRGHRWVSLAVGHALVPLDEQRVGLTADVLLKGEARLLQVGQGASGLTQLLTQRRQRGVQLPHLSFQAAGAGGRNKVRRRETEEERNNETRRT